MIEVKPTRKKYLDFLKKEIERYCNDKKEYELYWDYRDELSPESILSAYEKCQETGYPDIGPYLMDMLFNLNPDGDEPLYDSIIKDINQSGDSELISEFNPYNLSEDLIWAGYEGLDVNLDDLLSQSTIRVNVMFATESEQNLDMGSIVSSYGNDWQSPFVDFRAESKDFDNALTYLIHQQGHTVREVLEGRFKNPEGLDHPNNFVDSVVNEIVNNSAEAMSELTVLVKLSGNNIIDFFNAVILKNGFFEFSQSSIVGLFNEWSGCGGVLEIELEKPFVVPINMIRNIQIEGTKQCGSYSVNSVYGLVSSCWKDTWNYTNTSPELTTEDIPQTISEVTTLINNNEK